jgi:hypothetical protein
VSWEDPLPTRSDPATARAEDSTFCELMLGSMNLPVLDLFCGVGGLSYRPPRVRPPRVASRGVPRSRPSSSPGFRAPGTRRAELRRPARAPPRRRAGRSCRRACRPRFRHGRWQLLACDDPGVRSIATADGSREGLKRRASSRGADASCAHCRKSPSRTTYRRGCASGRRTPSDTLRSNRP